MGDVIVFLVHGIVPASYFASMMFLRHCIVSDLGDTMLNVQKPRLRIFTFLLHFVSPLGSSIGVFILYQTLGVSGLWPSLWGLAWAIQMALVLVLHRFHSRGKGRAALT